MKLQIPKWAEPLREQKKRYKILAGGRGSAKSETVARTLLAMGTVKRERVLCGREFQNSISESVHYLLKKVIESNPHLRAHYEVTEKAIFSSKNGSEFFFRGMRHNIDSIKSMSGITKVWLEEASTISKNTLDTLIPTIREPESEIWATFNPENEDDPVYAMFYDKEGNPLKRDDAIILKVNHYDNVFFPEVLKKEMEYLYSVDPELAEHVWGGRLRAHSDAQIFKNKYVIREFEPEPHWDGPYFGADWGFSVDPTTLVKVYINMQEREIMIRNARFGYHVELDDLPEMFDHVPDSDNHLIRADCARPETISYLSRKGFSIEGAEKWEGSVEDGIDFLKSFKKIVIHPECQFETNITGSNIMSEARNYSFKVDRLTGEVKRDIVDAYNHGWDAVRYALYPLIRAGAATLFDLF